MKKILFVNLFLCTYLLFGNTDKYRLILKEDPATTITIAWNQVSGTNPTVYYGTEDFGQNFTNYPNQKTVDRTTDFRGMNNQFARLTNLQPHTAYYFVIKDSEGVSERFWFMTATADRSRLSFIAGGDSRNNRTPRRNANKLVSKLKPNAVFFGGDMTDDDTAEQWQGWLNDWQYTTAPDGRMFPIIPARGNHEFNPTTIYQLFDTPNSNSYYGVTFGDDFFRIYTLNTLIPVLGTQKTWLDNDLAENRNVLWKSAHYHFPIRPHQSRKLDGPNRYDAWANTFHEEGVKLVIECDSHMVKTTYPVKPSSGFYDNDGFVQDLNSGTVYAGEGCWGAPLRDNDDDKQWTRASGRFNQFKWFFIDEEKIELRTVKVDNADEVGSVTNENRFELPPNLDVWEMPDGENTVYIYQTNAAEFTDSTLANYPTTEVSLGVNILGGAANVTGVKFYATNVNNFGNEVFLGEVTNEPYTLDTYLNTSGQHTIRAEIQIIGGSYDITKTINVGDYMTTTNTLISLGSNDISQEGDGDMDFTNNELFIGYNPLSISYESVGVRFENVSIPKNATIDYAYIEFTPSQTRDQNAEALITIEDTPDSPPFSEVIYNLRDRMKATEEVIWTFPIWTQNVAEANTQTPDLKGLLQYVIDLPDWEQGNAVTFSIKPTGTSTESTSNRRVAYSYENDPNKAPKLVFGFSYNSSTWIASAPVSPGVGINSETPAMPLDIDGLMRSSVRNENNELYECNSDLEGAIGYDKEDKTIKVCTEEDQKYVWKTIDL